MKKLIFLFIMILAISTVNVAVAKDLDTCFKEIWPTNRYTPLECNTNIYNLINKCITNKKVLKNAKVLFLLKLDDPENIDLVNLSFDDVVSIEHTISRNDYPYSWSFHVVLELNGKIYDFDFPQKPEVLETRDYFEQMFPMSDRSYIVREIKAHDYMKKFVSRGRRVSYGYFLLNKLGNYPAITFDNYIDVKIH